MRGYTGLEWEPMSKVERRRLALEFDKLVDHYIAKDAWNVVRQMESRWLVAYGSALAMQEILDQYDSDGDILNATNN